MTLRMKLILGYIGGMDLLNMCGDYWEVEDSH